MTIENQIQRVSSKLLSINDVLNWLETNSVIYILTEKPKKCFERTQQFFCFKRNTECLFIEVYSKLKNQIELYKLNSILKNELIDFEKIKNEEIKVKEWLFKNLHFCLTELWFFMSPNYPNIKFSFISGKPKNEFEYLKIEINGNDFKYVYDFANLFSRLFFEEKLLPNEYEKWKYENEIND